MKNIFLMSLLGLVLISCEIQEGGGALGDTCSGPADCESNLCVQLETGVCTEDCSADPNICPAGFQCTAGANQSLCIASEEMTGGVMTGGVMTGGVMMGGMMGGMMGDSNNNPPMGGTSGGDTPGGGTPGGGTPGGGTPGGGTPGGGTPGGGTPNPMMGDCLGIINCFNERMCQDEQCAQACIGEATPAAQQAFGQLSQCVNNSGCDPNDNNCLSTACGDEFLACQNSSGTTNPPMSNLSCAETLLCAQNCGADQNCTQNCVNSISQAEAANLQSYINCLNTNMCQDQACVEANCSNEYNACVPPGTQGCNQVLMCLSGCRDENCSFNCQIEGDDNAQTLIQSLGMCLEQNGCQTLDCPACSAQITACQND